MIRLIPLLSLCVLPVFLGGCQSNSCCNDTGSAASLMGRVSTLTAADSGKVINLRVGEPLAISLRGNASTGYGWTLSQSGAPVLAQSGSPVSASEVSMQAMAGAPERTTWTFVAQEAGEATLKLEYRRPWEKETAPAQTFEVKVQVAE